jgi:PAS domain S-box-containing protein
MTRGARSIRARLARIQVATATILLLVVGVGILAYEFIAFRNNLVRKTSTLSLIIGQNSTAALAFDDPKTATEVLSALRAEPNVRLACIYDRAGAKFATYSASNAPPVCPPAQKTEGAHFSSSGMGHFGAIVLDKERVGTIYIESSLAELQRQLQLSVATLLAVSGLAALLSLVTSSRLQRAVSVPIVDLAKVASSISATGDYTVRTASSGEGEVAQLVVAFNQMLDQLQQRDQALRNSSEALEGQTRILRSILDNTAAAVYLKDLEGRFLLVNRECSRLFGRGPGELLEMRDADIVPQEVLGATRATDATVISSGRPMMFEESVSLADGQHTFLSSKFVLKNSDGRPYALGAVSTNITERKRGEEAERLLAEAGRKLVASLDYEKTLQTVARIAIPSIADWTLLCVLQPSSDESRRGLEPRYVLAHRDSQREHLARDLLAQSPMGVRPPDPIQDALETRGMRVDIDAQHLFSLEGDLRLRPGLPPTLLESLGTGRALTVPLLVRGEAIGALSFVLARPGPQMPGEAAVMELARRCAMAIDNARLYRQATEAIRAREEFMSIAAHELRTPLTPLRLQMQMIRRALDNPQFAALPRAADFKRIIAASHQQVERLTRLVSDLLEVSRVAVGRMVLHCESVDLSVLVDEEIEHLQRDMVAAGCRLNAKIVPNVVGQWDRLRIVQIVVNLLTNALKYGRGSLIEVMVTADAEYATLAVRDHGIGIAKEDQSRIFDRFERAVSSASFGGLGLGLYITKEYVSAHRGRIAVESELGKGATFTVVLPLRPAVGEPRGGAATPSGRDEGWRTANQVAQGRE